MSVKSAVNEMNTAIANNAIIKPSIVIEFAHKLGEFPICSKYSFSYYEYEIQLCYGATYLISCEMQANKGKVSCPRAAASVN